jgi:hypothetical protein
MAGFFRSVVFWSATAFAVPAIAQAPPDEPQTRAEALQREREEKQRATEPYKPTGLERAMDLGENRIVPLLQRDGVYAKLGSLTTGSGFAYGAGFRDRSLVKGRGSLDLWAAASLKRYWSLEARARYPIAPGDRVNVEGYARKYDYPQEEYFGLGPNSRRADRTVFDQHGVATGGLLDVQAMRPLSFGGGVEYLRTDIAEGRNHEVRSIEHVFGLPDAPGRSADHAFVRTLGQVTIDYRQPLNARRGGFYRLDVSRYDDRRGTATGFTRTDLDLRQYVSFLAERRVLAGRMQIATTDADGPGAIPFFLLPTLGGNDTLRGFRAHRFRGPHSILLQGEYRWEIWSGLEAAFFTDAGKVTQTRDDLNFRSLEHDYGFGFRFNTDNGVVARVDAAFGSRDGKHLHIVFGGIF